MKTINILYFGKHKDILETVVRLINNHEHWKGNGVHDVTDAIEHIEANPYEIVLLGCGIDENSELMLRDYIREKFPHIRVVQHYGGGSGLLSNEILAAMQQTTALN